MNIRFDASVLSIVMGVLVGLLLVVGLPFVLVDSLGMSEIPANAIGIGLGFVAVIAGAVAAMYGWRKSG